MCRAYEDAIIHASRAAEEEVVAVMDAAQSNDAEQSNLEQLIRLDRLQRGVFSRIERDRWDRALAAYRDARSKVEEANKMVSRASEDMYAMEHKGTPYGSRARITLAKCRADANELDLRGFYLGEVAKVYADISRRLELRYHLK